MIVVDKRIALKGLTKIHMHTVEKIAISIATLSAVFWLILFIGSGLLLVRVILRSMSISKHILSAPAAPAPIVMHRSDHIS